MTPPCSRFFRTRSGSPTSVISPAGSPTSLVTSPTRPAGPDFARSVTAFSLRAKTLATMIDLRSDTVTRPTEAMLESMREATFGDDSRDGDETVRKLEALAAGRTGKEAGAFMPSGTMANLVAMLAHGQRGGEVLLEEGSHTLNAEFGGIAGVAGLFYRGVPGKRGAMDVDALREMIRPVTRFHMGTALVWMENTHNRAGGAVLPLAHMRAVHGLAREKAIPVHLDGARIFNAAHALGATAKDVAQ